MPREPRTFAQIYPIHLSHVERILEGKDVFAKYSGSTAAHLGPNSKLLFYVTSSGRKIVSEAIISTIEFLTPSDLLSKYRERLFITEQELWKYRRERSPKKPLFDPSAHWNKEI
jgi:hypothetical protein